MKLGSESMIWNIRKKKVFNQDSKKKTQEEMKGTLSEIKKNLQGTNSGRNEVKNEINDLEHKEEKKAFNQNNKEKKEF